MGKEPAHGGKRDTSHPATVPAPVSAAHDVIQGTDVDREAAGRAGQGFDSIFEQVLSLAVHTQVFYAIAVAQAGRPAARNKEFRCALWHGTSTD